MNKADTFWSYKEATVYNKDTPGFSELCKQITPIARVHKTSYTSTYLSAEKSPSKMSVKHRGEDVNKGRG